MIGIRGPLLLLLLLCSSQSNADFSDPKSFHHFFNSRLLAPGESQLSAIGNFKLGITDNLELGSQLALGLFGVTGVVDHIPNLSIKHLMFGEEWYQTSFNSHTFFANNTLAEYILSLHGVVTTYDLGGGLQTNLGFFDFFVQEKVIAGGNEYTQHTPSIQLGFDWIASSATAISFVWGQPMYRLVERDTFYSEVQSVIDLAAFADADDYAFSRLSFNSALASSYLEVGVMQLPFYSYWPYLNLWWRW